MPDFDDTSEWIRKTSHRIAECATEARELGAGRRSRKLRERADRYRDLLRHLRPLQSDSARTDETEKETARLRTEILAAAQFLLRARDRMRELNDGRAGEISLLPPGDDSSPQAKALRGLLKELGL